MPNRRQRPRNADRAQRPRTDKPVRRRAPRALTPWEQYQEMVCAALQRQQEQQQRARAWVTDAYTAAIENETGMDSRFVKPGSAKLTRSPGGGRKMILRAQIEVVIEDEHVVAAIHPLLRPFSGTWGYDAHPAPKPPPPPAPPRQVCGAAAPPHYGRMTCSLLEGHPLPHEHGEQHWSTTVRR